ncbi:MAG: 4Fe-4S dicluster domain-containing protein [Candidatus Bathyarchaeia archaeon]
MSEEKKIAHPIWIVRDYLRCSGCRRCEIACSLSHEGRIWPEASRVRVFMLIPGVEVPHLCAQCQGYPCVEACPVKALSVDYAYSGAVLVDEVKCTSCGLCIDACPGKIPHLHPQTKVALICDLCHGDPECAKVCTEAKFNALYAVKEGPSVSRRLFAQLPEEVTRDLAVNLYAEKGEELV